MAYQEKNPTIRRWQQEVQAEKNPVRKALSKVKGTHDISTGKTVKHKALDGAKNLSVNPSWMPLRDERRAIRAKNGESPHNAKIAQMKVEESRKKFPHQIINDH